MTPTARFGVTLPQIKRGWQEARDAAVEFDGLGYDSVWVCDHLYGVPLPSLPIFEAWSELAAVADKRQPFNVPWSIAALVARRSAGYGH